MRKLIIIISLFLFVGCEPVKTQLVDLTITELTIKLEDKQSFVLYIYKETCVSCFSYKKDLEEIASSYDVIIYAYNLDMEIDNEFSFSYEMTPSILIISNDATYEVISGVLSKEMLIGYLLGYGIIKQ